MPAWLPCRGILPAQSLPCFRAADQPSIALRCYPECHLAMARFRACVRAFSPDAFGSAGSSLFEPPGAATSLTITLGFNLNR